MTVDIADWAQSRFGFYVDRHYQLGKWVLQPGPIRLADYHQRILRHIFTPDEAGRLPYDSVAWCECAKSGKSALAGLIALYAGLHADGDVILASNKQDQALSVMYRSLTDSLKFNPHMRTVPSRLSVVFRNGNTVKAIASNSKGEAGARFSLAVFDELWGYVYEDAQRLWSEFKTDPTRLNSLKFAIGYAGYAGESLLWEEQLNIGLAGQPVKELLDIDNGAEGPACWANGRHFTFWSHVPRQPWQTDAWLDSQRASLRPAEYARMIECYFSEGTGNFVEPEQWAACINPAHTPLPPGDRRPVYVGLDLATSAGGDDCALTAVYSDQGMVKLAFHKAWKGSERKTKLQLKESVYPYLLRAKEGYNLQGVWFDPFQALSLAEDLRKAGIRCIEVPQTHSSRGPKDTTLYNLIQARRLMLYPHDDLKHLAAKANARELGNGLIFLKKASTRGKIDLLVSLSNVTSECAYGRGGQVEFYPNNPFYEGEWPWKNGGNGHQNVEDLNRESAALQAEIRAEADRNQLLFLKKYYPAHYAAEIARLKAEEATEQSNLISPTGH